MNSALLKKIAITLLIVPLLVYMARVGVADFLRLAPCAYVEAVQKGGARLQPVELLKSRDQLLLARKWDPDNPLIPEFLGQIAVMRAQLAFFSPRLQMLFLNEAIDEFDRAIILRPNSAFLWASRMTTGDFVLETNARLAMDDALIKRELSVLSVAIRRADTLAPWNPPILKQLVRVGARHYMDFSPDIRLIIDAAKLRSVRLGHKN